MPKEFITHEKGNEEAWICICGNRPDSTGFFPCDDAGDKMEPVAGWNDLYVCHHCGRIVQQHTLEVVGRKLRRKRLPSNPIAYCDMEERYNAEHASYNA